MESTTDQSWQSQLKDQYGYIFEDALLKEIEEIGTYQKVKAGEIFMDLGQHLERVPLVLSGAIKIMREDSDGNELLLYYLETGDMCAQSITCCMGDKKSQVRAVAEEDSEMILISADYIEQWLGKYASWKQYIFQSYNTRFDEFLETIDSIAFLKLDERILKYLKDKAKVTGSMDLSATHQEIAYDLNTSRVVVSRLLKALERQEKIRLFRNKIQLLKL